MFLIFEFNKKQTKKILTDDGTLAEITDPLSKLTECAFVYFFKYSKIQISTINGWTHKTI